MQAAAWKGIIGESSQFWFYSMAEAHHEGENQPAPEKQADRVERKSEHKAGAEASHGMGDLNKTIVAEVLKKRQERKSGGTDQLNKDDHKGKKVASADELLPLDKPSKAPLQHQVTEAPGQHQKLEALQHKPEAEPKRIEPPNFQRATEAATKALQSVINASGGALNETHKFLKGMGDGEVDFVKETGQSLAVARDYYGQALTGKVNVGADVKEFGGAIGQTLGTAGDYYLNQIPKGQANLGNDIGQAGKAAADHWNSLDSEQKGHFVGKEIVPLAVPGAVGIVAKEVQGANLVGKTGEAITALTSAEKVAQMEQKINQLQGHVQKFSEVLGKPLEPAYATVSDGPGRRPNLPELPPKDDNLFAMSKADEGEGLTPKRSGEANERESMPEKNRVSEGFKAELSKAVDNLEPSIKAYLKEHGVEIEPIRRINDRFPERTPNTMGVYSPKENRIYIAEEVLHKNSWIKNFDVDFNLRHESGHAYSYTFHGFEQVSSKTEFAKLFASDLKNVPESVLRTLGFDTDTFQGLEYAREEVFADSFGHATGCKTKNEFSKLIKDNFPNSRTYFGGE